jgi:excisionase family DNA binding protein
VVADEALRLVQDGLATIPEGMRFLGIGRATIYALMHDGSLAWAKVGPCRRIPWGALRAYAASCLSSH